MKKRTAMTMITVAMIVSIDVYKRQKQPRRSLFRTDAI